MENGKSLTVFEPLLIGLHLSVGGQGGAQFFKNLRCVRIGRLEQMIMTQAAVATRGDEAGATQVREMARDLRLFRLKHRDERAHANFIFRQQVNQSQPGAIGQRPEK